MTSSTVPHVDPVAMLAKIAKNFQYKSFVMNPYTTEARVRAAQMDVVILSVMGFLVVEGGSRRQRGVRARSKQADAMGFGCLLTRAPRNDPR
eukprot:11085033-Karenia_brevis.AAC.1